MINNCSICAHLNNQPPIQFREELGVDLARPRFRCLGRLADRLVRTRTPFCVATFVYIDMAVGGAPLEFRVRAYTYVRTSVVLWPVSGD